MKTIKQLTAGIVIASQLFATSAYAFDLSSIVHVDQNTKNMLSNLKFMANAGKVASLDQMTPDTLSQCSASSETYSPDNTRQAQAYISRFQGVTAKYKAIKSLTPDQALEVTCAALPLMRYLEQVDRAKDAQQVQSTLNADAAKVKSLAATTKTLQAEVAQGTVPASLQGKVTQAADQVAASQQLLAAAQSRDLANTNTAILTRNLDTEIRAAYRPLQTSQMRSYATRAGLTPYTQAASSRKQMMMPVDTQMIFVDRNGNVRDPGKEVLTGMQVTPKIVNIYRDSNGNLVDAQGRLVDSRGYPLQSAIASVNDKDYGLIKGILDDAKKLLAGKTIAGLGHVLLPLVKSPAVNGMVHAIPFLGNGLSMVEAISGKDWMTGETLDPASRLVAFMSIVPEGNIAAGLLRNSGVTSDLMLGAARAVDFLGKPQIQLAASALTSNTAGSVYSMANDLTIGGTSVTQTLSSVANEARSYIASNPATSNPMLSQAAGNQTYTSVKGLLAKTGAV